MMVLMPGTHAHFTYPHSNVEGGTYISAADETFHSGNRCPRWEGNESLNQHVEYQGNIWRCVGFPGDPPGAGLGWEYVRKDFIQALRDDFASTQAQRFGNIKLSISSVSVGTQDSLVILQASGGSVSLRGREGDLYGYSGTGYGPTPWDASSMHPSGEYKALMLTRPAPSGTTSLWVVDITSNGPDPAKVGLVISGNFQDIGPVVYGGKRAFVDFSKIEIDEFGQPSLVRRSATADFTDQIEVERADSDRVIKILDDVRAMPTIFDFNNGQGDPLESRLIYGILDTYTVTYDDVDTVKINIVVKGLS